MNGEELLAQIGGRSTYTVNISTCFQGIGLERFLPGKVALQTALIIQATDASSVSF